MERGGEGRRKAEEDESEEGCSYYMYKTVSLKRAGHTHIFSCVTNLIGRQVFNPIEVHVGYTSFRSLPISVMVS